MKEFAARAKEELRGGRVDEVKYMIFCCRYSRMKRILVIKACGSTAEPHECAGLCEQAELYGLDSICIDVKNNDELESALCSYGVFDYIYLSAHGNEERFSSEDEKLSMSWTDFAGLLCSSDCMNDDCVLMLSCCRGGLMQVAYTLFYSCTHISYVIGPRQSLSSVDMSICFGVFLYNNVVRKTDPVVACEKIKCATEQRFSCYDRQEEEINIENYFNSGRIYDIYDKLCLGEDNGTL